MLNPNVTRWLFASVADHFKHVADDNNIPLLIEGIEDRVSEKINQVDFAELRINGPIVNEVSKNYFRIYIDVNILIKSLMTQENAYTLMQNCGVMLSGMTTINIYKYGNGPDDDGSYVACLKLRNELSQPFSVNHIGQIAEDVRLRHSLFQEATVRI